MTTSASERRLRLRGLYAVTPETGDPAVLLELVDRAIAGGARLVQYRAKRLAARERRLQAEALLALCRERGVPLIVNDDLALAVALGADGIHLGRGDGDPREARARLPGAILGVSRERSPQQLLPTERQSLSLAKRYRARYPFAEASPEAVAALGAAVDEPFDPMVSRTAARALLTESEVQAMQAELARAKKP